MDNTITYLIQRLGYRVIEFIKHWYLRSLHIYWSYTIDKFQRIDYHLALGITTKNIFRPLYKDYTFLGYILGFIFRLLRIVIALVIYVIFFSIAAFLYLLWLLFPVVLIYRIITG